MGVLMSFTVDFKDFEKTFFKLVEKAIPGAAEKGLFKGMNELLRDAKYQAPQCPKDVGDLWGSTAGTVKPKVTPGEISVEGGFNSEYATRQHEAEPGQYNYTKNKGAPRAGPKFLSSKMNKNKKKYMEIVANSIRNAKA